MLRSYTAFSLLICCLNCSSLHGQAIKKGKPFLISPPEGTSAASASRNAQYLNSLLDLKNDDELRVRTNKSNQKNNATSSKQVYDQYHRGIKVEYGTVTTHLKNNQLDKVSGEVYDIPETLDAAPSLSEDAALTAATNELKALRYRWQEPKEEDALQREFGIDTSYYPKASLVYIRVYRAGGGKKVGDMALAYKFDIYAVQPVLRKLVYVDAHTGKVIHINNIIKHVEGTAATRFSGQRTVSTSAASNGGGYWLRDASRGNGVETYDMNNGIFYSAATDFWDNDNNWTSAEHRNAKKDDAALDAHWGAMKTYDFFKEKFDRNSYDDQGTTIRSYVHFDVGYVNAFWNGSVMTYGDGQGDIEPLTSIDICAHEIGHALCSSTADLVYQGESGALNESLSDIWGAVVEHYAAPEKSPWLMGEDINFVIRSLSNPNDYNQPDTYLGNMWDP